MLPTWSLAYLTCWLVATVVVFVAGNCLSDRRQPATHPLSLSVIAGAVWPMLVIGALELAAMALYTKARDARANAEVPEFWMTRVPVVGAVTLR